MLCLFSFLRLFFGRYDRFGFGFPSWILVIRNTGTEPRIRMITHIIHVNIRTIRRVGMHHLKVFETGQLELI